MLLGFGACAGIFYLGNLITVNPLQISGNGNPALLALPILLFLMLFIVAGWMGLIMNWSTRILLAGVTIIPAFLYVAYRYQANEFDTYRTYVKHVVMNQEGRGADWNYVDSITSNVFSIYMNNQLFNVNTFFMYIGLTLWIGIVLILLQRSNVIQPKLNR